MAVSTTLRRPEWNRRLYGTANLSFNSRTGVVPGIYLTISGDTTVMVMRELPNSVFACEILALPRGKTRSIFRAGDSVVAGAAPSIRTLVPASAPHNVAVQVMIFGVGFDRGATVYVGATQLIPSYVSESILIVTFTAASIASAGTVQIKVQNADAQQSATVNFTVT